jgi:hypothetical protein
MKHILTTLFLFTAFTGLLAAEEIKHRFLALDESRHQILYVDQFDPSKNWTIKVPAGNRDLQLVDGKIIIGLASGGFQEYDFASHELLREVVNPKYKSGSVTAYRLKDGRTLIASDQSPIRISMLDAEGKELSTAVFANTTTVRCVRMTPRGTVLFGNDSHIIEGTLEGTVVRDIVVPDAKHIYMVQELPGGNLLATTGYSGCLIELDKEGKIVRTIGGKPGQEGVGINFFASADILKNGNVLIANWTGHGEKKRKKGVQLLEYDTAGNLVWHWHDAAAAGSIHNAVVLE